MSATYGLTFGSLDWSPAAQAGDVRVSTYSVKRGSPVPVVRMVDSLLQDGGIEVVDRYDNRGQSILIALDAADSRALADYESTLFLEVSKGRNELTWTPPDGYGATTVFDVLWAQLDPSEEDDWDLKELRGQRLYVLTFRCLPFGRSATETVVPALTAGAGTETLISDGTSATGWTSPDGAVAVSSGKLQIPAPSNPQSTESTDVGTYGTYAFEATLTTTAIDFSTTPYLTFEYSNGFGVTAVYADGVALTQISNRFSYSALGGAGGIMAKFYCPDPSVTSLRFVFSDSVPLGTQVGPMLDNVKRTPTPSAASGAQTRILAVGGSARTQASLHVSHTAGLGDVVLYSAPGVGRGYSPTLGDFSVGTRQFEVPASTLPRGGYVLYARMKTTSASDSRQLSWTASTKVGATTLGQQSGTTAPIDLTTTYRIVSLGRMVLPPVDVADMSSAVIRLDITEADLANPSGNNIVYSDFWLFYIGEDSALTIVSCGTGAPAAGSIHNHLWVDAPTLDRLAPALWVGTNSYKTDAIHGGVFATASDIHHFPPGDLGVYLACPDLAVSVALEGRYYARWHTHAVD